MFGWSYKPHKYTDTQSDGPDAQAASQLASSNLLNSIPHLLVAPREARACVVSCVHESPLCLRIALGSVALSVARELCGLSYSNSRIDFM